MIAGGLGVLSKKPPIFNIANFEDNGVDYIIKFGGYRGKDALSWGRRFGFRLGNILSR